MGAEELLEHDRRKTLRILLTHARILRQTLQQYASQPRSRNASSQSTSQSNLPPTPSLRPVNGDSRGMNPGGMADDKSSSKRIDSLGLPPLPPPPVAIPHPHQDSVFPEAERSSGVVEAMKEEDSGSEGDDPGNISFVIHE